MSTFEVKLARAASVRQHKTITVDATDEAGARLAAEAAVEMDDNEGWAVDHQAPAAGESRIQIEKVSLRAYDQDRESAV